MDFTTFSISSSEEPFLSFFGKKTSWIDKQEVFGSKVSSSIEISSLQGFHIGDLVWGKVQSHPWWPGFIFNEAFAEPTILATRSKGHVLVAFFGDNSYSWFEPSDLLPFAPYFLTKSKHGSSRTFLDAIEEAINEERRRAALGLCCMCRNPNCFCAIHVPRYFEVDVPGYDPKGRYSIEQIERAREDFVPKKSLSFLKGLAITPTGIETKDIGSIKRSAAVLALRKAVFEEFDETYAQAFGQNPIRPSHDDSVQKQNKAPPKESPSVSIKEKKRLSCSRKKGKDGQELSASTTSKKRLHEDVGEGLRKKKKKKREGKEQIAQDSQSPAKLKKKHVTLQQEPSAARRTSTAATLLTLPIVVGSEPPQHSKPSSFTPPHKKARARARARARAKEKLVKLESLYKRLDEQSSSKKENKYYLQKPIENIKMQQKKNAEAAATTTTTITTSISTQATVPKRHLQATLAHAVLPSTSSSSPSALIIRSTRELDTPPPPPPPPPLEESPTNLVIRFPPSSNLPSQSELRARFAWFELLNEDQVSVNWKEHLCQVRFKYKKNALEACNYAKGTDLFRKGQGITYQLYHHVPVAPPPRSLSLQPEPRMLQPPPQLHQGTLLSLMSRPPPTQNLQLKSILKKPKPPQSSVPATPQPSSPLTPGLQPPPPPPPPQHHSTLQLPIGANGVSNNNNTFSDQYFLGLMTQAKEQVLSISSKFPRYYSWHAALIARYDANGSKV